MTSHINKPRLHGFSLTESLIALVILSFGLIALLKFQATMIESGGLIKSKGAAIALAQEKIEEFRNSVLQSQYTSLTDTPVSSDCNGDGTADGFANDGTHVRTNTSFTRCYRISTTAQNLAATPPVPAHKVITVQLLWTDPKEGAQNVTLNSIVTWSDPSESAYLSASNEFTTTGISRPSGGARLGGDHTYTPGSVPGTNNNNGTSTYTNKGVTELIDNSTGQVLLTTLSGSTLESISGNVYIDGTGSSAQATLAATYPVITDAGYCARSIDNGASYQTAPNGNAAYTYFSYTCYVGSSWYGSVGIIRTDNPNSNARVCVGDPASSTTALSTVRVYKGFQTRTDANGATITDANANAVLFPTGMPSNSSISNHHFLVTTITGNPVDADCAPKMVVNSMADFASNPDDFYCLSGSCPGSVTSTNIDISGTLTGGGVASVTVSPNNQVCTLNGSVGSYTYTCTVAYTTGTSWSGSITVNAATGYETCTTNPIPLTGLTANSSGNDMTLATTSSCPNVNYDTISGTISFGSGNGRIHNSDLSTYGVTVSTGSCTYSYTSGQSSASYTCTVRNGFGGTVSLTGYSQQDTIKTSVNSIEAISDTHDFSNNHVNSPVTGYNFVIYP